MARTVAETLTAIRRRDLDCEGIPMYLALNGAAPAPDGDPRRSAGERLARTLVAVHAEVAALSHHPRTRAQRQEALREAEMVLEGARTAPSGRSEAELRAVDLAAQAAVAEPERLLAEAVAVLAHSRLVDGEIELELPAAPPDPTPGGPLARMVQAMREGRFVTVVNYHNTPASTADRLGEDLARWGATHAPVRPDDMGRLFADGTWSHARPPLVPVLYEGYANTAEIAAPAVRAAGLVGWFFLIAGFLDAPADAQRTFANAHEIALAREEVDGNRRPLAMTWDQAGALAADGHVVTAHTTDHAAAHAVEDGDAVARQITAPAAAVERATGERAVAHAWLFGSALCGDDPHATALHDAGFRWVFSNTGIDDVATAAGAG